MTNLVHLSSCSIQLDWVMSIEYAAYAQEYQVSARIGPNGSPVTAFSSRKKKIDCVTFSALLAVLRKDPNDAGVLLKIHDHIKKSAIQDDRAKNAERCQKELLEEKDETLE